MQNKHTAWEMAQMMSLPLDQKILMTQQRIRTWYEAWYGQVYVSFSGGKDSTVLLHLVRGLYPEVEAVFIDTGLEYPEVRDHVKAVKNVTWLKPKMNFKEVITEYGYPFPSKEISETLYYAKRGSQWAIERLDNRLDSEGRPSIFRIADKWKILMNAPFNVSHRCCNVMKKSPIHIYEKETGKKPFLGTMAGESRVRLQAWLQTGCNAFDSTRPISKPLSFWTEQDILEYIQRYDLKIPSVYGEIVETGKEVERIDGMHKELNTSECKRTGCMFCMFGCHLEKSPNRFEMMKKTHPNIYDYCMKPTEEGGLGMKEVIGWINEYTNSNIKY